MKHLSEIVIGILAFFGIDILIIVTLAPLWKWWKNRRKK